MVLALWMLFFVGPLISRLWATRRFLADGMAVKLTRDPEALKSALRRIADDGRLPPGGEKVPYLFAFRDPGEKRTDGSFEEREALTAPLHPSLDRRLQRIAAMGVAGTVRRRFWSPGRTIGVILLSALIGPLIGVALAALGFLTAAGAACAAGFGMMITRLMLF
jgi:hypothetical protein